MKRYRHRQTLTACIAILAVLLLFIAPVVSTSLMQQQMMPHAAPAQPASHTLHNMAEMDNMAGMADTDDMATMGNMAERDGMSMPQHLSPAEHQQRALPSHAMTGDALMGGGMMTDDGMIACGYCDLLIHVPLIVWLFVPLIWLLMTISLTPPAPRVAAPPPRRPVSCQRPRAPPVFPLVVAF